jgi:hypothetical protein
VSLNLLLYDFRSPMEIHCKSRIYDIAKNLSKRKTIFNAHHVDSNICESTSFAEVAVGRV